ncbi:hypothetical protein FA13DRAFT_1799044 [Coprinellus micaceus]|uniref:Nucleoplasmin-like domain-containing protein n=1 Tax=Coprinellus micaceus TaxID=71717 RepID=A0A4Y7SK63_COPMI|nr:hypothetical protein FA13DRAFT_1799044 [Coprinellus micaceus]
MSEETYWESRGYMTVVLKASKPTMLTLGAVTKLVKITLPMELLAPNSDGNYQCSSLILHPLKRDGGVDPAQMVTLAALAPYTHENVRCNIMLFPDESYLLEAAGGLELHLLFKFEEPSADAKMTILRPWLKMKKTIPVSTTPASLNLRNSTAMEEDPQLDTREAKKARKGDPPLDAQQAKKARKEDRRLDAKQEKKARKGDPGLKGAAVMIKKGRA